MRRTKKSARLTRFPLLKTRDFLRSLYPTHEARRREKKD
nr:MAG TPA: hypothetical protein [Caudoviricetes sp.]